MVGGIPLLLCGMEDVFVLCGTGDGHIKEGVLAKVEVGDFRSGLSP